MAKDVVRGAAGGGAALNRVYAASGRELKVRDLGPWAYRAGADRLAAGGADAKINAEERELRESFGADKPVDIKTCDPIASPLNDEEPAAYNSLHFPASSSLVGEGRQTPSPTPRPRVPMAASQAEFAENWGALTMDLCELWKDLPLFAAGGAVLAALHRWPAVVVPQEISQMFAQNGGKPISTSYTEYNDARFIYAVLGGTIVCQERGIGVTLLVNGEGIVKNKLKRPHPAELNRADARKLGLMAFMDSKCWVKTAPRSTTRHVRKLQPWTILDPDTIKAKASVSDNGELTVDMDSQAISAFIEKLKQDVPHSTCKSCTQHFAEYIKTITKMLAGADAFPEIGTKKCRTCKGRDLFERLRDLIRFKQAPRRRLAPLTYYGAYGLSGAANCKCGADVRHGPNPECDGVKRADLFSDKKFDVQLTEDPPNELKALFPHVIAILCQSYVGVDAAEVLRRDSPRARILHSFLRTDIDLFLVTRDIAAATKAIIALHERLVKKCGTFTVAHTANAVTFILPKPYRKIQVILRLYHSAPQVLLGFDVDCCAVGVADGKPVALPRGARALATRQNLVDPTRQSKTYEARLLKYARRGFVVAAPGLTPALFGQMVKHAAAIHGASLVNRRRYWYSDPIINIFDMAIAGALRLVEMFYIIVHNTTMLRAEDGGHAGELARKLQIHCRQTDYDNIVSGENAFETRHGIYELLSGSTPLTFRLHEPHAQDRKVLFTGSFNPVEADWYHLPATNAGSELVLRAIKRHNAMRAAYVARKKNAARKYEIRHKCMEERKQRMAGTDHKQAASDSKQDGSK